MLELLRYGVFGVFVLASAVALGSWAIRSRRINPFGTPAQLIRRISDPILEPIEHWQHRRGGNPQNAPWWLLGGAIVGGIVIISLAEWLVVTAARAAGVARGGVRGIVYLIVDFAGRLVMLAILVRVIGSWLGVFRYHRLMRPFYWLTDWIVEPLRKVIPPFGPIDITPFIAWLVVWLVHGWILRLI